MTTYGYARVSADAQDYASQADALKLAGCVEVVADKASGASLDGRRLSKLIASMSPGDLLVCTKLDRLARSLKDLLNTLDALAKQGAGFKCLDVPALDTTTP
jgi:DNA invertase Pin-like site-specific DNA recombinase